MDTTGRKRKRNDKDEREGVDDAKCIKIEEPNTTGGGGGTVAIKKSTVKQGRISSIPEYIMFQCEPNYFIPRTVFTDQKQIDMIHEYEVEKLRRPRLPDPKTEEEFLTMYCELVYASLLLKGCAKIGCISIFRKEKSKEIEYDHSRVTAMVDLLIEEWKKKELVIPKLEIIYCGAVEIMCNIFTYSREFHLLYRHGHERRDIRGVWFKCTRDKKMLMDPNDTTTTGGYHIP